MGLVISCDANAESGVGKVVEQISGATEVYFKAKYYGTGLLAVCVVLMCRNPELNFKRRIRFSKKEKILYMDIMLDLAQMRMAEHQSRRRLIIERLADEVPAVLRKYSLADFDEARFIEDFKNWLDGIN